MMTISRDDRNFKKAVIVSVSVHLALFVFIIISPYLPKPGRKGMVHYVNLINLGGGGGGGGPAGGGGGTPEAKSEALADTPTPPRETLRDLTTPQNLEERKPPDMTHPVEKPKRAPKKRPEKKASISKSAPTKSKAKAEAEASGGQTGSGGPGVGIGIGSGGGSGPGVGFGPGFGGQGGSSNVPYAYYLQNLQARVSSSWVTAQIRTGLTGDYHTIVRFRILRNGSISDPEIVESSKIRTMDLSAIRAVRGASPFPPLPPEYEDEYMIIVLYFQHGKQP